MTSLKGKVAWITGGGSGIGLAGAVSLAREGAQVVITGRTKSSLDSGLAEVKKVGSAEAMLLDVADREAVLRVAADIEKRHGRIDILVTSAGTNISGAKRNLATMSLDGWDDVVRINLDGLFYCCYAVIPGMRKRKDGLIINISSWAGRYASLLTGPAYNATKRAVIAITESINMEECANGIRATSVLPGEVATPIMAKRPVPPSPERMAEMVQPEDLGETILYLAKMPPRTCINELIISPTRNRFYMGGLEAPKG
jgi:NADP-dependent 3-hydroxy acid dehydrogenase YdfG